MNELSRPKNNQVEFDSFKENIDNWSEYAIEIYNNSDNSILNQMKKMIIFGFSSFIKICPESDEIRPENNKCIQNFGFQSTVFESLEVLYLLNLTKFYNIAKKIALKYFKTAKDNHVTFINNHSVRSELFNRIVGSLIGTYFVSKDKLFLDMSEQLVDSIMFIDSKSFFPYSILNLNLKQGFERSWENGTSVIDIISGFPEILSLYKITKKDKYLKFVKNILEKLKNSTTSLNNNGNFQLSVFYDSQNGHNKTVDYINNINLMYFHEMYEILLRSYHLIELQELKEIIPESIISGRMINDVFFDSYSFSDYLNHNGHNYNIDNTFQTLFDEKFEFDAIKVRNKIRKFSYLSNQVDENQLNFESNIKDLIEKLLNETEKKCKSSFGYSGLSFSNSKRQRKNNIQHSSFFGNWANSLALALKYNASFWKHALFNTRGHLLYI